MEILLLVVAAVAVVVAVGFGVKAYNDLKSIQSSKFDVELVDLPESETAKLIDLVKSHVLRHRFIFDFCYYGLDVDTRRNMDLELRWLRVDGLDCNPMWNLFNDMREANEHQDDSMILTFAELYHAFKVIVHSMTDGQKSAFFTIVVKYLKFKDVKDIIFNVLTDEMSYTQRDAVEITDLMMYKAEESDQYQTVNALSHFELIRERMISNRQPLQQ